MKNNLLFNNIKLFKKKLVSRQVLHQIWIFGIRSKIWTNIGYAAKLLFVRSLLQFDSYLILLNFYNLSPDFMEFLKQENVNFLKKIWQINNFPAKLTTNTLKKSPQNCFSLYFILIQYFLEAYSNKSLSSKEGRRT